MSYTEKYVDNMVSVGATEEVQTEKLTENSIYGKMSGCIQVSFIPSLEVL